SEVLEENGAGSVTVVEALAGCRDRAGRHNAVDQGNNVTGSSVECGGIGGDVLAINPDARGGSNRLGAAGVEDVVEISAVAIAASERVATGDELTMPDAKCKGRALDSSAGVSQAQVLVSVHGAGLNKGSGGGGRARSDGLPDRAIKF